MTTDSAPTDSAAIQLLQMVWAHKQEATSHSWLKLNHAMRDTLELAVKSGMRFNENDFIRIFRDFRASYWVGSDSEWFYNLAVIYRNTSAWRAYEKWAGRTPFIVAGASISVNTGDGPAGHGLARLIVSAWFKWDGERVRVNSFNDAKGYFNAASYARTPDVKCPRCERCWSCGTHGEDKVLNLYRITHGDLRAARKAGKAEGKPAPQGSEKTSQD